HCASSHRKQIATMMPPWCALDQVITEAEHRLRAHTGCRVTFFSSQASWGRPARSGMIPAPIHDPGGVQALSEQAAVVLGTQATTIVLPRLAQELAALRRQGDDI